MKALREEFRMLLERTGNDTCSTAPHSVAELIQEAAAPETTANS